MHSIIPLLIGWGLDLCAGDPARLPHPIVAFGRWISFFERKANHGDHRQCQRDFLDRRHTLHPLPIRPSRLGRLMDSLPAMGGRRSLLVLSRDGHTYLLLSGRHDAHPGSAQSVPRRRPFFGRRKAASKPHRGTGYKPPQRPGNTHRRSGNFGGKPE